MMEHNHNVQPDDALSKRSGKRMGRRAPIWVSLFLLIMVLGVGATKLFPTQATPAYAAGTCASLESSVISFLKNVQALNGRTNTDIIPLNTAPQGVGAFAAANDLDQYVRDYSAYFYPGLSAHYAALIPITCNAQNAVIVAIIRSDLTSANNTLHTINGELASNSTKITGIVNSTPSCPYGSANCNTVIPPAPDNTINYDLCVPDSGKFALALPNVNNGLMAAQGQVTYSTDAFTNSLIAAQAAPEIVYLQRHLYPESASHIEDAIRAGYPPVLTLDRYGPDHDRAAAKRCDDRRKVSTGNYTRNGGQSPAGTDRDEYPFASTLEGGDGTQGNGNGRIASVRAINLSDNRGFGTVLKQQTEFFSNGTPIKVEIIP